MGQHRDPNRQLENEIKESGNSTVEDSGNSKVEDSGNAHAINITYVDGSATALLMMLVLDLYSLVQKDGEPSPLRDKIMQHVDTILEREQLNQQILMETLKSLKS